MPQALVVFLIILLIYLHFFGDRHFREIWKYLQRYWKRPKSVAKKHQVTVGYALDDVAKSAIKQANEKEQKYSTSIKPQELPEAATNAAVLAGLQQYNLAPNAPPETREAVEEEIAKNYRTAIQRAIQDPSAVIEAVETLDKVEGKGASGKEARDELMSPEHIVDQAENFYREWRAKVMTRNPEMTLAQFDDLHRTPNFNGARQAIRQARRELAAEAAERRRNEQIVQNFNQINQINPHRVVLAGQAPPGFILPQAQIVLPALAVQAALPQLPEPRQAAQQNFFRARAVYNDPQNVHDPAVTTATRSILERIRKSNQRLAQGYPPDDQILNHIEEVIASQPIPGAQKERALQTYRAMLSGDPISSLNSNETEVLLNVYKRILSPENVENRQEMTRAFVDSLASSVEEDQQGNPHLVCITGRCSRVLSSLTLLDSDGNISRPLQTTEMVRNEALSKASRVVQDSLAAAPEELRRDYNNSVKSPEVEAFEEQTKQKIAEVIRGDYSHLEPRVIDNIILDAQAGV